MDLVVDANVLFSASIKKDGTDKLLFSDKFHLFTKEYIFTELEEHKEEILKKNRTNNRGVLQTDRGTEAKNDNCAIRRVSTIYRRSRKIKSRR